MSDWGKGAINGIGWGQSSTNSIGYGSIYETSYAGDTALIGTSAAFLYSKSSFNQGEADPTPTITGTAGGSFNADAGVVFVDTGTFNSSTGQIDLSATSIGSHIITYTVNGVQSGQTVGVTAVPYASTSSFTFDGVDSYFNAGNPSELQFTSDFSISGWFKTSATSAGRIVSKDNISSGRSWLVQVQADGSVIGVIFESNSAAKVVTSSTGFNNGNWHNFVFTYEEGVGLKLYIDNSTPASLSYTNSPNFNQSANVEIGRAGNGINAFEGQIDEVSIWNTALSQSAVTEIASGPNDLTTLTNASNTNLKAWYKF